MAEDGDIWLEALHEDVAPLQKDPKHFEGQLEGRDLCQCPLLAAPGGVSGFSPSIVNW